MFMLILVSVPMPMVVSLFDFISKITIIVQKSFGRPWQSQFILGPIRVDAYADVMSVHMPIVVSAFDFI